jgi:hypothetical protein
MTDAIDVLQHDSVARFGAFLLDVIPSARLPCLAMKLSITAADLRVALDNLFTTPVRFNLFKDTAAYIVYGTELDEVRALLPLVLKGNRPLAKDLSAADTSHDSFGNALWLLAEAIKAHPGIDSVLRDKATRMQTQFIPNLAMLKAKYKKEAQTASFNRSKVVDMEADLKSIPTPDGRTAYDWVVEFLDSGDHISTLLEGRSKIEADEPGVELMLNRTRVLSLVIKARSLVADEVEKNNKLPKNAEAIVFGYFDTLAAFRTTVNGDEDQPPPAAPPPAAPSNG